MKSKKPLPKHVSTEFTPPLDLSEAEKIVWLEITEVLRELKTSKISDADYEILRQYCQLTITRNRAWEEYNKKPERYTKIVTGICADGKTPKIVLKDNEHYKTWLECNKHLESLLKEMELNPKSRKYSTFSSGRNYL